MKQQWEVKSSRIIYRRFQPGESIIADLEALAISEGIREAVITSCIGSFSQLKLPRGIELTEFDGSLMKINGRETIQVNGQDVYVDDDEVTIGKNKLTVDKDHLIYVDGDLYELRPKEANTAESKEISEKLR